MTIFVTASSMTSVRMRVCGRRQDKKQVPFKSSIKQAWYKSSSSKTRSTWAQTKSLD